MRLSTRSRLAITAMIDLALRDRNRPVPLSDLARRHGISLSYLEQVFAKLRQRGLVCSARGPGGGYTLGFQGDSVSIADIVGVVDARAQAAPVALRAADGAMQLGALWTRLHKAVFDHMRTISLKSLADEQRRSGVKLEERQTSKKTLMQAAPRTAHRPTGPNSVFALADSFYV